MANKLVVVVFIIIFGALLLQIYQIDEGRRELRKEMATISGELDLVSDDNKELRDRIQYFSDPRNLEKELRARFNYRLPYEKLIIVVPEEENNE